GGLVASFRERPIKPRDRRAIPAQSRPFRRMHMHTGPAILPLASSSWLASLDFTIGVTIQNLTSRLPSSCDGHHRMVESRVPAPMGVCLDRPAREGKAA